MGDDLRTPDGRYIVMVGASGPRLWRASNPSLGEEERARLVADLMAARRAVKAAQSDREALAKARRAVDAAKQALGERGPVWWADGDPDLNRTLVKNSPYAPWWDGLSIP